jgi:hypothetical protein
MRSEPHDLRLAHGLAWLREDFYLPHLSPAVSAQKQQLPIRLMKTRLPEAT